MTIPQTVADPPAAGAPRSTALGADRAAGARAPRRRPPRRGGFVVVRTVVAVVASVVVAFPLLWMLVVAFSPRGEVFGRGLRLLPSALTLENFGRVLDRYPVAEWFGNSVVIGVFVTVLTVVVNLLAGYAFAQLRFAGRTAVFLVFLATLMIPVQATMVAQFRLVNGLEIYGTYWAVILPSAATAFGVFLARQFMLGIPQELIEAARLDGAGPVRVFTAIVLPLSGPLVAVLVLLTLLGSWNDFAWPLIALKDPDLYTLPVGLLYLKGQTTPDYNGIMALAVISVLPMVVLFLAFQRFFVQGFVRSGVR
ncbi:carbohydrate ABC transporter permease [Frigoribacterium sp. Leaf164]|uniref:carbohydrate ABC transporter permease n=1 Tax=unclassified Frigoribacterium TaxID=2627005 RepID=UPI001F3141F3|nr:carbohydrate ABC transporter permease [Frigoribacterium sp. Leaf164]